MLDSDSMLLRLAHDVNLDPVSTTYLRRRLHNEGIKFLTETLPKLSRAVLRSLELGYFDRPTDFRWKGKALSIFQELLSGIFCLKSGKVLEKVDATALARLRQFCDYFYKLSLPFDEKDLESAERDFVSTDAELATDYDRKYVDQLRKDFETYYSDISRAQVHDIYSHHPVRPGPGTYSNWKSWGTDWFVRKDLPLAYPAFDKAHSGYYRSYHGAPKPVCAEGDPNYSEVLFVPKDSRGPRVIVREPFSVLLGQMSFNSFLSSHLEKATSRRVNFQSQQVNRDLAEASSIDRRWCTIDLKSASDRVSHRIMSHIFMNSPGCRHFINNRTRSALLPVSKTEVSLNKLAGMGSGLTFPSMSLLITLTITRAFVNYLRLPYARARKLVYVYGDDIVVPTNLYDHARLALERVFLSVNKEKSFRFSHFRESCGADFYNGVNVAPVRLRLSNSGLSLDKLTILAKNRDSALLQLERHCRELIKAGLTSLADYYYSVIENHLGTLPDVSGSTPVLGRYSLSPLTYPCDGSGTYRKVSCYVPIPVKSSHYPDPYVHLGRFLRSGHATEIDSYGHVSEGLTYDAVTVPRRVVLRRRALSAFRLMG